MKICAVGAEVFDADGRIDGQADGWRDIYDKANSRFTKY